MTSEDDGEPDSDPRHLDPAGELAHAIEDGDLSDMRLATDANREEIEEFVEAAESGEFGPADPGLESAVRIARALLDRDAEVDS